MSDNLIVGTRGSLLARAQTGWVMERIAAAHPGLQPQMQIISTTGDRVQGPLPEVGGKGLFTEELERALLDGTIDIAVHSCKDLPTKLADGLTVVAYPRREDPRDAWVSADGRGLDELMPGSAVGTTSLRRQAQLRMRRPDIVFVQLRGNVDTRIRKVREGQCAAAVLAMSGLIRAGLAAEATHAFEPDVMMPAPGQGALAIEGRADDARVRALVAAVDDLPTRVAVECERAVLAGLQAGCRAPVGVLATVEGGALHCAAVVADPPGQRVARAETNGPATDPAAVVARTLEQLQAGGAAEIVAACR